MTALCTLNFFGNVKDFDPNYTPSDEEWIGLSRPRAQQSPYIFITIHPQSLLPMTTDACHGASLPILLEHATPSCKDADHILDISGKIFCPYDMRVYDPDGYAFIGTFDPLSQFGTLEFRYHVMLPKDPPRPDVWRRYKRLRPIGQHPYYTDPQRGAPIIKDTLPF